MQKILIIDKDKKYAELLATKLDREEREIICCDTSLEAIIQSAKIAFEFVIAYSEMEDINGVKALSAIKEINSGVKSVLVTDSYNEELEILTIEKEIDLFFYREKSMDVLVRKMEKMMDDDGYSGESELVSLEDGIYVDANVHMVYQDGKRIELTRREYDLLHLMLRNKGKPLSREEIMEKMWETSVQGVNPRAVDGYVKHLRQKLHPWNVESVRGYGYVWHS